LGDVKRRLNKVEADADQRPIDKPIAHVIEFGAEKRKEQQYPERFRKFLNWGRSKRSAQEKRAVRAKVFADVWVLRQPTFDPDNDSSVERQSDSGRDDRAPQDGNGKEPRRLALPSVEVAQDENRND
jgi:hypothetical protein